jgi:hypothetical protein
MDSGFEQAQRFAGLWMDYAQKMMQAGMTYDPSKAPPEVARQMRSMAFAAMAQYAEQFMRSPEFLEAMKQSLDAAVTFRQQINEFLTSAQHSVQGVARADVDSLMLNLKHTETRVLDVMSQINAKLDALTARMDALESKHRENGQSAQGASDEQRQRSPGGV